ncbi:MAG: hypothetical protein A2234_04965 [Elusimicrobia bacterium RIFOXYA2_FULL_58_8]|nr:MAG: hypothetical protein A2234_04965 [Elusimicrobia bacterium RIFOXYA2_FULL_58_8]OGS14221.1 MAG: hypothetical protein A2285_05605 [Elusimicrobia bacterium RIFOXYA12_FULL_57_11]
MKKTQVRVAECADYLAKLKELKIKPSDYAPAKIAVGLITSVHRKLTHVMGDPEVRDNYAHKDEDCIVRIASDFKFHAIFYQHPRTCMCGCYGEGRIAFSISGLMFFPESDKYPRVHYVKGQSSKYGRVNR